MLRDGFNATQVTASGLTKTGAGTLRLSAANTYTGTTRVTSGTLALAGAGTLALAGSGTLGASGPIIIDNGGTLDVSALAGVFVVNPARSFTANGVILGSLDYKATYAGPDLTVAAGGLSTRSSGALALSGAVVNNGTIRLTSGATLNAGGATSFVNNGVLDLIAAGAYTLPANFTNGPNGVVLLPSLVRTTSITRATARRRDDHHHRRLRRPRLHPRRLQRPRRPLHPPEPPARLRHHHRRPPHLRRPLRRPQGLRPHRGESVISAISLSHGLRDAIRYRHPRLPFDLSAMLAESEVAVRCGAG